MRAPGLPGSQFPGDDAQARKIRDLERALQELKSQIIVSSTTDAATAANVANENSLTRAELNEHFLPSEGLVLDGGTP